MSQKLPLIGALLCAAAAARADLPPEIKLAGDAVVLRNIRPKASVPADESVPVEGLAQLAFRIAEAAGALDNIPFTKLTRMNGAVTAVTVSLPADFRLPNVMGPGTELVLPRGEIAYSRQDSSFTLTAQGRLLLPTRDVSGQPTTLQVGRVQIRVQPDGSTVLSLSQVGFAGGANAEPVTLPGVALKAAPADFVLSWKPAAPGTPAASTAPAWKLTLPRVDARVSLPDLPTVADRPLQLSVANFTVDQDGLTNFDEAEIQRQTDLLPADLQGFQVTLKSGRVAMRNNVIIPRSLVADVTLPEVVKTETNARVIIRNLNVTTEGGLLAEVGARELTADGLVVIAQGLKLRVKQAALDLSSARKPAGVPAESPANAPAWKGLWIQNGALFLPRELGAPQVTVNDFLVEPQGLTGRVTLDGSFQQIQGFPVEGGRGSVTLKRNQVTACDLRADLNIPRLGKLGVQGSFTAAGQVTMAVRQNETLSIPELKMTVRGVRGSLEAMPNAPTRLSISGELGFESCPGLPDGLRDFTIALKDLGVDSTGKLYLPEDACLTFPNPKRIPLGPVGVELRRIAFETRNNELMAVSLSGGADLGQGLENLPLSGGIDFEGLTIARDDYLAPDNDRLPDVRVGGVRVEGRVEGIGTIQGELHRKVVGNFGEVLYGDALLRLECLGPASAGIGLDFLIAPSKGAWFVGGNAEIPAPILISLPASPPVPLFNILGFAGGFGWNVTTKQGLPPAERGRISDPERQLEYSPASAILQAGLLLGDQAGGKVWWAEAALTLGFNPVFIELAGKAAFLDVAGEPRFIDLDGWEELDRTASLFMALDSRGPSFMMGGGLDFYFPTRSANLLELHGQAEMRFSPREKYLRVGWKDAGQKPVSVVLLAAARDVIDIRGEAGFQIDLQTEKAGLYFDTDVRLNIPDATVRGTLKGALDMDARDRSATGRLRLKGTADFGLFEARVSARLRTEFNTSAYRSKVHLAGSVTGKAGPFEQTVPVRLTLP